MNTKSFSAARSPASGFTLPEMLGVVAILAVLAAVFFPMFQGTRSLPNGTVRDGSSKPFPSVVLRFRDSAGHVVATVAADDYGNFRRPDLDSLSHDAIDGFGLTHMGRRTGVGTLYTFSPLGTHIATFRDKAGKPIPHFAVSLTPNYYAWHQSLDGPLVAVSDKDGVVHVPNRPLGGRFMFYSQDPNCVIERTQATANGNTIRYAVTVNRPGS